MEKFLSRQLKGMAIESAGLIKEVAGRPATPETLTVMEERGIDLSAHRSRWIGDLNLTEFSHIICVGEAERQQVRQLLGEDSLITILVPNEQGGGIFNPWEKGMDAYRQCIRMIEEEMPRIAETIRS